MDARLVYQGPQLTVAAMPGSSRYAVLAFSPLNFYAEGEAPRLWGEALFRKHGIAAIGITARSPNWFPPAEMHAAAAAIRALLAEWGLPAIGYGHSMGGYAALKYARLLGLRTSLALSPQISIDPVVVGGFDARFAEFFQPLPHAGQQVEASDLAPASLLVFDPLVPEDRGHAAALHGMPGVHRVLATGAGHMTIGMFTESEAALALFAAGLLPAEEAGREIREVLRRRRRRNPDYLRRIHDHLADRPPGRFLEATRLALAGMGVAPESLALDHALSLEARGETAAAAAILATLPGFEEVPTVPLLTIRNVFARQQDFANAIRAAEVLLHREPADADGWVALSHYQAGRGHIPLAQAAAMRGLEATSNDPHVWIRMAEALTHFGLPGRAREALALGRAACADLPEAVRLIEAAEAG